MKDRGLKDLKMVKRRLIKSYGMGRIEALDFAKVMGHLDDLIKLVEEMKEELPE